MTRRITQACAGAVATLGPGVLGLAVFFIVTSPLSGLTPPDDGPAVPALCGGWHRGNGESKPFDLERTERGYREFKQTLSESLSKSLRDEAAKAGPVTYDAGLRACTKGSTRRSTPERAVPEALRGRRIWFFASTGGKTPRVPQEVVDDQNVIPLATKVERFEDLATLSKQIGRPVSPAPKGLGEALGVRCVPALVTISKDGEVEIHEDP